MMLLNPFVMAGSASSYAYWSQVAVYLDVNVTGTLTDAKGHVITPTFNAQVSTALGFPTALFDGSGDYLSVAVGTDCYLSSGDFRIRLKMRAASLGVRVIAEGFGGTPGTSSFYIQLNNGSGQIQAGIYVGSGTAGVCTSSNGVISTGVTYDVEFGRSGSNFQLSVDGVSVGTATSASAANNGPSDMLIGGEIGATPFSFDGHIWGFSIEPGVTGHTGSFTPDPLYL